ncbi:MAG: hypothetical protein IH587_02570 [Anaerolineae bacterium]|nr:hypothetical protein [Anaerolineae bacterium]
MFTDKWHFARIAFVVVSIGIAAIVLGQPRAVESQESGSVLSLLHSIERQQEIDPELLVHVSLKWGDRAIYATRLGQYSADYACFVGEVETCIPIENIGTISFNGLLHR